jgi:hypothetical protein
MRSMPRVLRSIFLLLLTAVLLLNTAVPVHAAAGGQRIKITACQAVKLVIKGTTSDGTAVNYTFTKDAADCGTNKIKSYYFTGTVKVVAYYYVSSEYPVFKGQTTTVTISAAEQLEDYYAVTVAKPSARTQIVWRASTWVTDNVAYSSSSKHDGYRQDCSGFVSYTWQLTKPGTSPSGLKDSSYQIAYSKLKSGDALISSSHAMLFIQWVDQSKGTFIAYEEENATYGTMQRTLTLNTSTGVITQGSYYTYAGKYKAYRLNGL